MKEQVKEQLNEAIRGIVAAGNQPSQLMLDIQTVLNQPESVSQPGTEAQHSPAPEGLVDLSNPKLVPAIQRLMNCNPVQARQYVNVVARATALSNEQG